MPSQKAECETKNSELFPDAWKRFEQAVKVVTKAPQLR
jgi:hypothetical protein